MDSHFAWASKLKAQAPGNRGLPFPFLLCRPTGPSTRRRPPRPAPRHLRPPPSPTVPSPSPLLLLHGQIHAGVLLHLRRRAASPSYDGSPGEDATSSVRCTASPSYRKSSRCRPSSSARSAISPGGLPCQLPNDVLVPPRGRHTSTFTEPQGASPPFSTAATFDARSTTSSPVLMYEAADDDFSSTPIVDWTPDFSANVRGNIQESAQCKISHQVTHNPSSTL